MKDKIQRADKRNVKIPVSGNAPASVYVRSKELKIYLVSMKSASRWSVRFGVMGWESDCE